jgi:sporulation protein YlmC with PRC-barrel domain
MSRKTMCAAIAALLAASTPLAFAQTTSTPSGSDQRTPAAEAPARTMANHLMPGQIRFSDMNGATVRDGQNKDLGDVKDVVLDRDGRVAAVVLDVGAVLGIGGKNVAVPMSALKVATDRDGKPYFATNMTEDQLKSAQAYELTPATPSSGSSTEPNSRRQ